MRAVGEIPSSNNLRLQNLVESQLEKTKTESCLIALSAKLALEKVSPHASRLGLLIYWLLELGRYVATERNERLATDLRLELGRYVATELRLELGRYVATERNEHLVTT
ncbi:hypothetical protein F2Q69_00036088 [Brassica cretica]|uniref:Uncharacterized protein n=1 Tax=Brassica cretica TaxID=69181 RepID=A0A8S9SI68_BRACR|nr:hypothetical protein F2Q69_00036088 [Brassica cretica]